MAAGDWAAQLKLGRPGSELSIGGTGTAHIPPGFSIRVARVESTNMNVIGETVSRVRRRIQPQWTMSIRNADPQMRDAIMSLQMIPDGNMSFLFADEWGVYAERHVMDSLTSFKLRSNSYFLLDNAHYNLSPTGTATVDGFTVSSTYAGMGNLTGAITVSSYNRATYRVTITPTQTTNQVVYVNYRYDGALVKFASPPQVTQANLAQGNYRGWNIAMILQGI